MSLIVFDLEWNIGYNQRTFDYHGVSQVIRGEIIQIGAAKVDEQGNVLDTFSMDCKPRIFRKLQHHIAKVTGFTQARLDAGVPIREALQRFMRWCGPDARLAEWGLDDVPVLKQNLFLCGLDETQPTVWYDLQQVFCSQRPRGEGEGMTLESVIERLGLPTERPFHDALSDALYTCDVCRCIDLKKGLAEYPTEEQQLIDSASMGGACHTPLCFYGYAEKEAWRTREVRSKALAHQCGGSYKPELSPVKNDQGEKPELWMRRGSNRYYSFCTCSGCGHKAFVHIKLSRRDGLHWAYCRVLEDATAENTEKWNKQKKRLTERPKQKPEAPAAEG